MTALPLCLSLLPRTKTVAYADPTASPCGGAVAEGTERELVPADGSLEEVQALEQRCIERGERKKDRRRRGEDEAGGGGRHGSSRGMGGAKVKVKVKVKEDGKKREGREGIGCCSWCAWTGGRDGECVEVSPVKR